MHDRPASREKPYRIHVPYPVSETGAGPTYADEGRGPSRSPARPASGRDERPGGPDLITDPWPTDALDAEPPPSNASGSFRPLQLLNSLFADRIALLRATLDELDAARKERERLAKYAMEELDPDILKCDRSLAILDGALDDRERRAQLERRLFELKRERRREAVLNWRDLLWLRGEIRKLQRELDSLAGTAGLAEEGEAPG